MKNLSNKQDLIGKTFIGRVVDNNDPLFEGRAKVVVYGVHELEEPVYGPNNKPTGQYVKVEVPADVLPWAHPYNRKMFASNNGGCADISVPKIGTIVRVQFAEGDIFSPEFTSIQTINADVIAEIQDSYINSHVLAFDVEEQVKIFYTPSKGLTLYHKESQLVINPDSSITIEHKGGESIVELIGDTINIVSTSQVNVTTNKAVIDASSIELGAGATEAVIKGNTFQTLFNAHTHVGNAGFPTSPPVVPLSGSELSTISKTK
jgi:hypothetical protein